MLAIIAALAITLPCASAFARSDMIGHYRANSGPDSIVQLEISADGRFRFQVVAGALDQYAEGRWEEKAGLLLLFTEPVPKAPEFQFRTEPGTEGAPLVIVSWPNGRGIAGIDVRVGFATGEPVEGYTQEDGWSLPDDETRTPEWIELAEPINQIVSARFQLGKNASARVTFIPNDLGVVAFDGAILERMGDGALLRHPWGPIDLDRIDRQP